MKSSKQSESASELISEKIAALGDWRGETLGKLRALIREAVTLNVAGRKASPSRRGRR